MDFSIRMCTRDYWGLLILVPFFAPLLSFMCIKLGARIDEQILFSYIILFLNYFLIIS